MSLTGRCIAVLAIAWAAVTPGMAQTFEPQIDRPGGDYRSFDLPVADAGQCASACAAEGQCVAFTYVNPGVQGPMARCWLKNVVPNPVPSACCTSGLVRAAPPPAMPRVFANPMLQGMSVDRCLYWAQQCDAPAATAYCRSQGMSQALSWTWSYMAPTYVQGDGRVCSDPNGCGGFTSITCQ
jgi:hypothetical protein